MKNYTGDAGTEKWKKLITTKIPIQETCGINAQNQWRLVSAVEPTKES